MYYAFLSSCYAGKYGLPNDFSAYRDCFFGSIQMVHFVTFFKMNTIFLTLLIVSISLYPIFKIKER